MKTNNNKINNLNSKEISDLSSYANLMRTLPINSDEDADLEKAFEEYENILTILEGSIK